MDDSLCVCALREAGGWVKGVCWGGNETEQGCERERGYTAVNGESTYNSKTFKWEVQI